MDEMTKRYLITCVLLIALVWMGLDIKTIIALIAGVLIPASDIVEKISVF